MEEQRKAVRAMQEYIREHITEDITPADLAKASNFSPWYARKLFIKHLGMAPAVYIRRLRLSMSALRLRDEEIAILDIAMEMGFGCVDGYQRAFRREFGCNPKEYALSPVPIWLFTPYRTKGIICSAPASLQERGFTCKLMVIQKTAGITACKTRSTTWKVYSTLEWMSTLQTTPFALTQLKTTGNSDW